MRQLANNTFNISKPDRTNSHDFNKKNLLKNFDQTPFFSRQAQESPQKQENDLLNSQEPIPGSQEEEASIEQASDMHLPLVNVMNNTEEECKQPQFNNHNRDHPTTPQRIRNSAVGEVEAYELHQELNSKSGDNQNISGTTHRRQTFTANMPNTKSIEKKQNNIERREQSLAKGNQLTPLKNPTLTSAGGQKELDQVNSIFCQTYNMEAYFRRSVKRIGWIEVAKDDSLQMMHKSFYNSMGGFHRTSNFHARFNISDTEGTDLRPNQHYNHFPGNREFTTKGGLCKNLWHSGFTESELQVSHFFPRCYDLSNEQQTADFLIDFNQTAIMSILSLVSQSFLKNQTVKNLVQEYNQSKQKFTCPRVFKAYFKQKCEHLDCKTSNLNENLKFTFMFCKELADRKTGAQVDQIDKFKKKPFPTQKEQILVDWHSLLISKPNTLGQLKATQTYFKVKIVIMQQRIDQEFAQHRKIDGQSNVWIVKPSYNARGLGIYCTRSLKEVMPNGKKQQQKVVQKYIEKPFCVDGRKFDFRQWVLVNSWEPLDVSIFQTAYLKMCGSAFDLNQLTDTFRHLSNFTLQKKGDIEDQQELTMSTDQFEVFMEKKLMKAGFTWQKDMLPKIKDVVWRSLKSVQETQEQKNNCYEIYGFDIVLDAEFDPWIIEINLSPACAERTEWLSQMLEDSTMDMLGHLEQRILLMNPHDWPQLREMQNKRDRAAKVHEKLKATPYLNEESFYEEHHIQNRWIRLEESIAEIKDFQKSQAYQALIKEKNLNLEVAGNKFNARYEKKLEKSYRKEEGAKLIQRVWLGFKGRQIATNLRQKYASIKIQQQVRVFLAKLELTRRRQNKAAIGIQKNLRVILAKNLSTRIRQHNILNAQKFVALRLQSHFRRIRDKQRTQRIRENARALLLQKLCRGYVSRKKSLSQRAYRCKMTLIQKFYKRRHKVQHKASQLIQRFIKGYNVHANTQKLLHISRVSYKSACIRHKLLVKQVFGRFRQERAVTKISAWFRCVRARSAYIQLLQFRARTKVARMFRRNIYKKIQLLARNYRIGLARRVRLLQSVMKGYLARKRVTNIKQKNFMDTQAIMVQKYMRGMLALSSLEQMRVEIGASIMIQACWKGYRARQRLKQTKILIVHGRKKQERIARQHEISLRAQRGLAVTKSHGNKRREPPSKSAFIAHDKEQAIAQKLHHMRANFMKDAKQQQQSLIQRRIEYLKNVTNALGENENLVEDELAAKSKENRTAMSNARYHQQTNGPLPISQINQSQNIVSPATKETQNVILQRVLNSQQPCEEGLQPKDTDDGKLQPTLSKEQESFPSKFVKDPERYQQQDTAKAQYKNSVKKQRDSAGRKRKNKTSIGDNKHGSSQTKLQSVGANRVGIKRSEGKEKAKVVRDVYSQNIQRFAGAKQDSQTSLNRSSSKILVSDAKNQQPPQTTKQNCVKISPRQNQFHGSHTPIGQGHSNKLKVYAHNAPVNRNINHQSSWMAAAQMISHDINQKDEPASVFGNQNLIYTGYQTSPNLDLEHVDEEDQKNYDTNNEIVDANYSTYETIPNEKEGSANRKYFNAAVKAYTKSLERQNLDTQTMMRMSEPENEGKKVGKKVKSLIGVNKARHPDDAEPQRPTILNTTFMDGEFDSLTASTRQAYMLAAHGQKSSNKNGTKSSQAQHTNKATNMPLVSTTSIHPSKKRLLSASSSRASVQKNELRKQSHVDNTCGPIIDTRGSSAMREFTRQLDMGEEDYRQGRVQPGQEQEQWYRANEPSGMSSRLDEGLPQILGRTAQSNFSNGFTGHINKAHHYFNPPEDISQQIMNQTNTSNFARSFDQAKFNITNEQGQTNINNYKRAVAAFKKTSTSFVENIQKQQKIKADTIKQNIQQQTQYTKMLKVPPVLQQQQILAMKKQNSKQSKLKKMSAIAQAKMIIL